MYAYKLFRVRKDGTLGPLFINTRQRVPKSEWLKAEAHRTKGFAYRPGWHCSQFPYAPHLKQGEGRAWYLVDIEDFEEHRRPDHQGGLWFTAQRMRVVQRVDDPEIEAAWLIVNEWRDGFMCEAREGSYYKLDGSEGWSDMCPLIEPRDYYLFVSSRDSSVSEVDEETAYDAYRRAG